jgi:cysteine/O-acetylserine efflux protein
MTRVASASGFPNAGLLHEDYAVSSLELFSLASFVIATTFTPGPNNLIATSISIQHGLRRTMPTVYGVATGFFILMISCGFFAAVILEVLPAVETWIRWVGGAYIIWLAYKTMTSGFSMESGDTSSAGGFWPMVGFQFMNPKAVTFGMTVFSAFMADYLDRLDTVFITAIALTTSAFVSTLVWAAFGAMFKQSLRNESIRTKVRISVGLLLIYVAVDLVWV